MDSVGLVKEFLRKSTSASSAEEALVDFWAPFGVLYVELMMKDGNAFVGGTTFTALL
jgi:hypothetical protein